MIEFLQGYFYLHGVPFSIRVDHTSCLTSQDFKSFCDFNNFERKFRKVGKHRSNGLVKKSVQTVKLKLLAMAPDHQKPTLQYARGLKNYLEPSFVFPIKTHMFTF